MNAGRSRNRGAATIVVAALLLGLPATVVGEDDDGQTQAERIEALREAIRTERAALEQERERRRSIEEQLEAVRGELEQTRSRVRELERDVEDRSREAPKEGG